MTTNQAQGTAVATSPLQTAEDIAVQAAGGMMTLVRRQAVPTLKYLANTEVHTYAFSVAANAILSFFPAVVLVLTLSKQVFHSSAMKEVVRRLLIDYLPSNQEFIFSQVVSIAGNHKIQAFSLIMLIISSTGIFEPLEVALNSVWGIKANRSYIGNQVISLGLALGCGLLILGSIAASAGIIGGLMGSQNIILRVLVYAVIKAFAVVASILVFFLIYWLLPNGKVSPKSVLPAAIITGALFEVSKYLYMAALPILDFRETYGMFSVSVTLMFWAFIAGLLLLAGAHLSAAEHAQAGVEIPEKE